MKFKFVTLVCLLGFVCGNQSAKARDLEALSDSPIWQVRYCVPGEFNSASPLARKTMEKLAADGVVSVRRHTFAIYSRLFVELDEALVKSAFGRGDFDLVGVTVTSRKVFEAPEFWARDLESDSAPTRARGARAIGLCGSDKHIRLLETVQETTNPHLLIELALAYHRLGDPERYLVVLDAILALPIADAFHYQNRVVDCLLQTHPARARASWNRVHTQFEAHQDSQPNWVFAHIEQESRLPKIPAQRDLGER